MRKVIYRQEIDKKPLGGVKNNREFDTCNRRFTIQWL